MTDEKLTKDKAMALLDDWKALSEFLRTATEDDSKRLLDLEKKTRNRESIAKRIFMRYNRMRRRRELGALVRE